jgi:hypothetical protein
MFSYLYSDIIQNINRLVPNDPHTADYKQKFASVGSNIPCYARQLTAEESTTNGWQFGTAFFFMIDKALAVDIWRGDTLEYKGDLLGVEGVTNHEQGKTLPAFVQVVARKDIT